MKLIDALAAGVRGAEAGTAHVYRRGTTTRVSYYTDFEATAPSAQSSSGIQLDANGGAVVYVDAMVNVVVKNDQGATVRTFVAGGKDVATEVISRSFTGTNYVSGASGASKPTNLQTVLDAWYASAGALDFKVTVNGTSTNLSSAIQQGVQGFFYNVKSAAYGAVGNGTTDDTASIQAAINAADDSGGVVLLPGGTYRITSALSVPHNVSICGAGADCVSIVMDNSTGSAFYFPGTTGTKYRRQEISGFRLSYAQANTSEMVSVLDAYVQFDKLRIESASGHGVPIKYTGSPTAYDVLISDCTLVSYDQDAVNFAAGSSEGIVTIRGGIIKATESTRGGGRPLVNASNLFMTGVEVDPTTVTSPGGWYAVTVNKSSVVSACRFKAPGNSGGAYYALKTGTNGAFWLHESGCIAETNVSILYNTNTSWTVASASRVLARGSLSTTGTSISIDSGAYQLVRIAKPSGTASLTINDSSANLPCSGLLFVSIYNTCGSTLTVSAGTGFIFGNLSVLNNKVQVATFINDGGYWRLFDQPLDTTP